MFQFTQLVLKQLLSAKNTHPERLSATELAIADRVCHCTLCETLWVRIKAAIPERCPHCHSRMWDRPFLSALEAAHPKTSLTITHDPTKALTEGEKS